MSHNGRLTVACTCGWETTGSEAEVVHRTQEHGVAIHNMEVTRDEVLAMSRPAPSPSDADS